ncbi:hypothetical protein [Ensifer aridi]|uniref:hypothetical protein n=1 Tax=Ensifer aridi TaxID=1708715 RepID=UPI000A0FED65|nr:hypothetical protein [Ensifer aridi]
MDGTGYTFPDVFAASWCGGPAAFEIQLTTTQLPNIVRREDFYAGLYVVQAFLVPKAALLDS